MRLALSPILALFAALMCLGAAPAPARPAPAPAFTGPIDIFAAASLREAIDDASALYKTRTGISVRATYASSAQIARQLEQGAPADMFISADREWMTWASQKRLVDRSTIRALAGNHLVLVAPKDSPLKPVTLDRTTPLLKMIGTGRIAIAEVTGVPAGRYAKTSLQALGLWTQANGHLAEGESVRSALSFVARGETPLGIVYLTDAMAEPRVKILATFPDASHPPIVYPAAVSRAAAHPRAARTFLDWLSSREGQMVLRRRGFTPPPPLS